MLHIEPLNSHIVWHVICWFWSTTRGHAQVIAVIFTCTMEVLSLTSLRGVALAKTPSNFVQICLALQTMAVCCLCLPVMITQKLAAPRWNCKQRPTKSCHTISSLYSNSGSKRHSSLSSFTAVRAEHPVHPATGAHQVELHQEDVLLGSGSDCGDSVRQRQVMVISFSGNIK